ncbi:hypothetical protein ND861_05345 [Leptospira sp. 2 VSF19]|uniref:Cyclase n=1 Tax=Leptospira soteropolitanensis TaxID=2950025 RepID=A0AAW5VJD4_9LEPT|nr:hypothetical protein [Leptospira soteropolitanensis]MCW7492077.1 hypothetical protein [Leptospira soteropolitanensis]MCW7499659.1 hypothetical protein [Leptospira soteropolitanensis]MCW7521910.1 hypothetical protein [Leptospira soteropolitanensis]MCW7525764.1 hypothetical protein [Leptospira soteropolitanensis]MCW7530122.1 hypothetical protein [Leptospira soteropolitanensis]
MNTFIYRSSFPIKREDLFQFHEDPIGFETLVGGANGIKVIKAPNSLLAGEEVVLEINILPFWKKIWVAKHISYQKNEFFTDNQEKGPFLKFEHTHRFLDGSDGRCILSEEIQIDFHFWTISRILLFPILFFMFHKRHTLTGKHFGVRPKLILCRYS